MDNNSIKLTAPEISGLWSTYIQNSAVVCILKHFLSYLQDSEIKPIVEESLRICQSQSEQIKKIYAEEQLPIPKGFSDADVDLSAPPLYSDLYALSFVYRVSQVNLTFFASNTTKVARNDVVSFFTMGLESITKLYKQSLNVMLSKGVYDRPPKIKYPEIAEYVQEQSFLGKWFGEQRPLTSLELGEIFFIIERNYIGLLLIIGAIQVMKDKEIKQFLLKGKKLSEK